MDFIDAMERLLLSGTNLTLNAMGQDHLRRLVNAARSGGASITIVGGLSYENMIELANLGGKCVTFDIAKYPAKE